MAMVSRLDRDAMALAIEQERAQGATQRRAIDDMLHDHAWHEVGRHAAWSCQDRALKLRPWDSPPCCTKIVDVPEDVWSFRPAEVALLKRMLKSGVSRYHPDPIRALAEAETQAHRMK
jgi:hypothetical protein